jgi:hypothetical protein
MVALKTTIRVIRGDIKYEPPESTSVLLKKATALKEDGNLNDAISALRNAYLTIQICDIDYGIGVFLRLPMYLQEAKRNNEAWHEFNNLLTNGYPNMQKNDAAWKFMESQVYDKMRLFLQRENNAVGAVKFGILSYISLQHGHLLGGQEDPILVQYFQQGTTRETIKRMLVPILKKAKQQHKVGDLLDLICRWIISLSQTTNTDFEKELSNLMSAP